LGNKIEDIVLQKANGILFEKRGFAFSMNILFPLETFNVMARKRFSI
jgi:hypothetical protein